MQMILSFDNTPINAAKLEHYEVSPNDGGHEGKTRWEVRGYTGHFRESINADDEGEINVEYFVIDWSYSKKAANIILLRIFQKLDEGISMDFTSTPYDSCKESFQEKRLFLEKLYEDDGDDE